MSQDDADDRRRAGGTRRGVASAREAALLAGGAGIAAVAVLLAVAAAHRDGTPFGPGELDLLLAARSMAAGVWPPLWAGAVHPDATGTYLGAAAISVLLRAGLPDAAALLTLGCAHFGLLVGACAGLAARLGGRRAGALAATILVLGAPMLVAAHGRYLATTVEAAGLELALLWAALELRSGAARVGRHALWGALTGLSCVFSLHAVAVASVAMAALATAQRGGRRLASVALGATAAVVPFVLLRDPAGPPRGTLTIKGLGPLDLLGLLDLRDATHLLARLPLALLPETERLPADSPLLLLHAPLAVVLFVSALVAARAVARGALPRAAAFLVAACAAVSAPLLVAGDLIGFPSAYRYFTVVIALAAVLAALLATSAPRRWPTLVLLALSLPGLVTLPHATSTELSRPGAAFFAGQHRLAFPDGPLHAHFLMLTPFVSAAELPGWLQGYGLQLGREYTRQVPTTQVELAASTSSRDTGLPLAVNRFHRKLQAAHWLQAADWLGEDAIKHLLVGVGLGIAEDGWLDAHDLALLTATGGEGRRALMFGIGAALGERWHFVRGVDPLQVTTAHGWSAEDSGSFGAGLRATGGPNPPPTSALLPGAPPAPVGAAPVALAHPHPFTYADLGAWGRGQTPTGPR